MIAPKHSLLRNLSNVFLVLFIVVPVLFSCKKKIDDVGVDLGYDYFPTDTGKYVIYDVDSILFNKFTATTDTFKFQIKEVNQSHYTDNSGRPTVRIERYKKKYSKTIPYSVMTWTLQDVWSANRTATSAEKVEENVRYVKLIFPLMKSKTWNGNAFNTIGQWDYKYTDIDKKRTLGGITFDSTAFVTQFKKVDALNQDYYYEIYAKDYGMVYKEIFSKHYDSINAIPSGISYKMIVNSVGP